MQYIEGNEPIRSKIAFVIITFVIIFAYAFKAIRLILKACSSILLIMLATPFLLICYFLDPSLTAELLKELKKLEFGKDN